MLETKLASGQLWELRGWGKSAGMFLLLKSIRGRKGSDKWLALSIQTGGTIELWDDFAADDEYATRVV